MKLLNILHIVHHERSDVRSSSHTFPRPVFPYFDEHHPPLWGVKAFEQQGAGGSSRVIEPFNPDPETSNNLPALASPAPGREMAEF